MRLTIGREDQQLLRLENAILERERAALISASARPRSGNSRLRAFVQVSDQAA